MLCKECWIYRQKLEGTKERLSNLDINTAKFLGKEANNPTTVAHWNKTLDELADHLDRLWRKLVVEIGDRECTQGRCILLEDNYV